MKFIKGKKGNKYVNFDVMLREALKDPKFRKAYNALEPKYALIHAILDARIKRGITQAEIAKRAGTTQSAIARFESGVGNPTLDFMQRVSAAIGARLQVRVVR